jgi:hypothetical protein
MIIKGTLPEILEMKPRDLLFNVVVFLLSYIRALALNSALFLV